MTVDSTNHTGKKPKASRQHRLLVKQNKLLDELVARNHQLGDQLFVKQNKLLEELVARNHQLGDQLFVKQIELLDDLLTRHHQAFDEVVVKQHTLNLLLLKQYKHMFASGGAAASAPAPAEGNADLLMQELLAAEGIHRGGAKDELKAAMVPATVAKPAVLDKKPVTQEKPTSVKTKPKPKKGDEDAAPPLPTKYWIALGILVVVASYCFWPGGPAGAGALVHKALTAPKLADKQIAVAELVALSSRDVVPGLRRLFKESTDPDVLADVILNLKIRSDQESLSQLIAEIDNPSPKVSMAAYSAVTTMVGEGYFRGLELKEGDGPEKRELVKTRALEKLEDLKKMAIPPSP
jgi:hypothetical protein